MSRHHSHVRKKKRSALPLLLILIVFVIAVAVCLFSIPKDEKPIDSEPADTPSISEAETPEEPGDNLPSGTVRVYFDSEVSDTGAPAYLVKDGVAPRRLEITLYNTTDLDIKAIKKSFEKLGYVNDIYETVVLDDSQRSFNVEVSEDFVWQASEYNKKGYFDLTLAKTGVEADDTVYLVRSSSQKPGEALSALAEEIYDFNPSIVKTSDGKFCVIASACLSEEEANSLLELLDADKFFIEESTIFSNPE